MNRHSEAIDAYKNAIQIEPDNQDYKNNLEVTQQRLEEQQSSSSASATSAAPGAGAGFPGLPGNIDFAAA
jgi:small glutamine-rich tetratricopeptide repeat-containing protein alpha